jgi:NADPH2:quinone reductase
MKAIAVMTFGGPEALESVQIPEPHPGPAEVRIRVAAASVNPSDVTLRSGLYGSVLKGAPPHVPGWDAAGTIDEVGDGADWAVGDEVMAIVVPFGLRGGAYAEQIVVPADSVARIPAGSGLVAASTLPLNGLTARQSLDQLGLQPGQALGVTGAAGAYGGYVVQLAKADGLRVIADASQADELLVTSLGADVVVRRGDGVAERIRAVMPGGVDAVADGAALEAKVIPAIRDGGGLAVIHGWQGPAKRGITIHQALVTDYAHNRAALDRLRQQVEEKAVTLRVAATFPADQAAAAHRQLEAGGTRGRLVLQF